MEQETPEDKHNKKRENDSKEAKAGVNILSFHVHPFVKFLFCAVGINFSYLNYGIVQEHIHLSVARLYKQSGGTSPRITTFILLTQAVTNAVAARLWMMLLAQKDNIQERHRGLNHGLLLLTATSYSLAMTASNESLYYVSYPAASLAKSCKLIPSMIAGVLVDRKTNRIHEWFGALCLTSGIVLFQKYSTSNGINNASPVSSVYGFILLFMSLFMDGVLGWCQGLLKKKQQQQKNTAVHSKDTPQKKSYRPPTSIETMLWTNLYSILFFFPYAILTGQLSNGISLLCNKDFVSIRTTTSPIPLRLLRELTLLAALAASGQFFIFYTIQEFSPIVCATITTTRKFLTILASVYRYGHILSVGQWASVGLVFFGLYVQIAVNFFHSCNRSLNVPK